jgi:mRNA interferase MazF
VSQPEYSPERGDLAWVTLSPSLGHEQSGRRPVVVLSEGGYNARVGMMICCPITSRAKGYPLEFALPPGGQVSGVALADQIKSVDWRERRTDFIEQLPASVVSEILRRAQVMLSEESPR